MRKRHVFDLVNTINYSSGLGGCTESCFSVLDSEQQGLAGDGLKDVLHLIIWPAQPREFERNFEIPLRNPIFKL